MQRNRVAGSPPLLEAPLSGCPRGPTASEAGLGIPHLDQDMFESPTKVRPDSERELRGSERSHPPSESLRAGSSMFLDGPDNLIDPQEVFLPSLDEPDPVLVKGNGARVLRVESQPLSCGFISFTVECPLLPWDASCLRLLLLQVGFNPSDGEHLVPMNVNIVPDVFVCPEGSSALLDFLDSVVHIAAVSDNMKAIRQFLNGLRQRCDFSSLGRLD